jgi:hypothetical protein
MFPTQMQGSIRDGTRIVLRNGRWDQTAGGARELYRSDAFTGVGASAVLTVSDDVR